MSAHDFSVRTADGGEQPLGEFAGKYLLIVNVASHCGFTPQYEGLEAMHRRLTDDGLVVLGFPCNQFGAQEPGTDEEIQSFCRTSYDVTFPVFAKIDVNGPDAAPLYRYLRSAAPAPDGSDEIKWNFTKFLIGPDGEVIRRYETRVKPEDIERDLEQLLAAA
jgi:glutathione peroxidase